MKNFTLFFLFSFINTYAQINFEKGYFIDNSNKITNCYIKAVDWKDNPTTIEYKLNLTDKSIEGSISNISEFGIDNECKYKRFTVNIEKSVDDLRFLTNNKNPVWVRQSVFLKVLIEGDANLYVYVESNITKYFYETKNTPIEQLIFIKFLSDEGNSIRTNNQFRQQLYNNVKCGSMTDKEFETISYNKSGFLAHFTKYNSCTGSNTSSYVAKNNKGDFNFKITAAIHSVTLSIKDPSPVFNVGTDIDSKVIFGYGLEFEYILPFNKNKWGIFVNPTYQTYEAKKEYINSDGVINPMPVNHKVEITYKSIEIPIGLHYYMFINKNSKLFLNTSYSINITSGSKMVFDDGDQTLDVVARNNFVLGFGYCYKDRFGVELKSNLARDILGDQTYWQGNYNTIGLQVSYKVL